MYWIVNSTGNLTAPLQAESIINTTVAAGGYRSPLLFLIVAPLANVAVTCPGNNLVIGSQPCIIAPSSSSSSSSTGSVSSGGGGGGSGLSTGAIVGIVIGSVLACCFLLLLLFLFCGQRKGPEQNAVAQQKTDEEILAPAATAAAVSNPTGIPLVDNTSDKDIDKSGSGDNGYRSPLYAGDDNTMSESLQREQDNEVEPTSVTIEE